MVTIFERCRHSAKVVTVLQESGYDHRPDSFAEGPRRSFRRLVRGDKRVEHVHVVTPGHPSGEEQLAMRDFLRAEPQARHAYCTLKSDLARKHPKDAGRTSTAKSSSSVTSPPRPAHGGNKAKGPPTRVCADAGIDARHLNTGHGSRHGECA